VLFPLEREEETRMSATSSTGTKSGRPDGGPKNLGPRMIAIIGPYGSGKTTLLESILHTIGATSRKGSVSAGNTVGDSSAEARARQMSTEPNTVVTTWLGDQYAFVDCPGSIEFLHDTLNVIAACDAAVVVTEPDPAKAQMLQPFLKALEDSGVPRFVFVNKIDKSQGRIRELLEFLQPMSATPLVLRQVPIWENEIVTGFVDLALERAYVYREHAASEIVDLPSDVAEREKQARYQMLEKLADYDDHLMEELLSDIEPPADEVFADLAKELSEGLIVPVLLGSAERDNGIRRLLKALRHETPGVKATAQRLGVNGADAAFVMRTSHSGQGKLSYARILAGTIKDGAVLTNAEGGEARIGGMVSPFGDKLNKVGFASAGDLVALGRLDPVHTGDTLSTVKGVKRLARPEAAEPVYALAIAVADRKDEVKLTAALQKLAEEDPSLTVRHDPETHELVLSGQGEIHLKVAMERLGSKFGLKVTSKPPRVPYRETIRKGASQHARHKKQSGGHGQFADITVEIRPLARGEGFLFEDRVTGGAVPRQYIPSVEKGVRDALEKGAFGFPVVDLAVALLDGKYHDVDSSNEAFIIAGRLAMHEALPTCSPVLLEPVMAVEIAVPSHATAAVNGMVSSRRGHIQGFDAREGWPGWDVVRAEIPQSELQSLIVELRSATQGVGGYTAKFDHLAELVGRPAEAALAHTKAA
jgi:elongation factor G